MLTGLNVTGVEDIQFAVSAGTDSNGDQQNGQLIQEIEVFGTVTSVPEPAVLGLLIPGLFSIRLFRAGRKS